MPRLSDTKADGRAAREQIAAYHQAELRSLLEHVRAGFAQLDADEIDEFELDDLIHHYKRSAAKLWTFCGQVVANGCRPPTRSPTFATRGRSRTGGRGASRDR